jgi:hypothetical protein
MLSNACKTNIARQWSPSHVYVISMTAWSIQTSLQSHTEGKNPEAIHQIRPTFLYFPQLNRSKLTS